MADATSIETLSQNNITLQTTEQPVNVKMNASPILPVPVGSSNSSVPAELSTRTINQIVTGIQQAAQTGMTQLPSRDIPMGTQQLTQDVQIKPNYVPESSEKDYIEQHDSYQSLLNQKKKSNKEQEKLDTLYEEFQIPLLVMVLFFFFQMPYLTKVLTKRFPGLYLRDGSPTFGGYLTKTLLFGLSFYALLKGSNYLGEM
jgi:hypothetical protein